MVKHTLQKFVNAKDKYVFSCTDIQYGIHWMSNQDFKVVVTIKTNGGHEMVIT